MVKSPTVQNNINGVSVDIKKEPTPTIGNVSQVNADKNWVKRFLLLTSLAKWKINIAVMPCNIGARILMENSETPKTRLEKEINQAINGGLEKYPQLKWLLQSQYCASSADNSKGEFIIARHLAKTVKTTITVNILRL